MAVSNLTGTPGKDLNGSQATIHDRIYTALHDFFQLSGGFWEFASLTFDESAVRYQGKVMSSRIQGKFW